MRFVLTIIVSLIMPVDSHAGSHGLPAPAISCNINTGKASDASTCASTPATCNNSGDDTPAFASFNTWATGTWQSGHTGLIELDVSGNCRFATITSFALGIKKLRIVGYGATFTDAVGAGHLAGAGQFQDNAHSARIQTVTAGSTSITLTNAGTACAPSCIGLFSIGNWVLVSGFDLQGFFGVPFGFPSNSFYFEYAQITNIVGNVITFAYPLRNTYKSTWPVYNNGSAVEVDSGGAATIYALRPGWDTEVEYRGVNFVIMANNQWDGSGRSVTFRDTVVTGSGSPSCIFPTLAGAFTMINASMSNCQIEVDKNIDSLIYSNVTAAVISFQSPGANTVGIGNSNISFLSGSGHKTTIASSTLNQFKPGAYNYGRSDEVICSSCIVNIFGQAGGNILGGLLYKGINNQGLQNMATMSGGVIKFPSGSLVSAIGAGTGGVVRLTVGSTTGFTTGQWATATGVFSGGSATTDGAYQYNVIDSTHVDLVGTTAAGSTWGGAGAFGSFAPRWAVPGNNLFWTDENGWIGNGHAFQVIDVTQDANYTYVATSLAGGFPAPIGPTGTKNFIQVHPAPRFTCTNCSGSDTQMASFNNAPAGAPLWSYQQFTFNGSVGAAAQQKFGLVGNPAQININVTNAWNSATNFHLGDLWPVILSNNTSVNYSAAVNAQSVGNRQITLAGITCVSGTCTGDTGLAMPDSVQSWFTGMGNTGPAFSINASGSCPGVNCPSVTLTMQTNQGVVNP